MNKSTSLLIALITACLTSQNATALMVWDWITTDGMNTAEGTLTTTGDPVDLTGGPNTFTLVSIDSVDAISGPGVTSDPSVAANWNLSDAPPFSDIAIGSLIWDGSMATVSAGGLVAQSLVGMSGNTVGIGEPGVTASTALRVSGAFSFYDFIPTSSTFSPQMAAVPEPATMLPIGILSACLLIRLKRSRV